MRENPKAYDPSYIKVYNEEASNQEGAFCTKYIKKDVNKFWNLMLAAFAREQQEKSKNINTPRN